MQSFERKRKAHNDNMSFTLIRLMAMYNIYYREVWGRNKFKDGEKSTLIWYTLGFGYLFVIKVEAAKKQLDIQVMGRIIIKCNRYTDRYRQREREKEIKKNCTYVSVYEWRKVQEGKHGQGRKEIYTLYCIYFSTIWKYCNENITTLLIKKGHFFCFPQ